MLYYPDIDPIAVALGPVRVHWYGLMYLVGFAGVVLMMRPTPDLLRLVALVPLAAACVGALRDVVTRRMGAGRALVVIVELEQIGDTQLAAHRDRACDVSWGRVAPLQGEARWGQAHAARASP